eukprot:6479693-Karenia_brevis.AAC.1
MLFNKASSLGGTLLLTFWIWTPEGLFQDVLALSDFGGVKVGLFVVEGGVIQGDPIAALLFALALDPCLHFLQCEFVDKGFGTARACADDIGLALKNILGLAPLHHVFG